MRLDDLCKLNEARLSRRAAASVTDLQTDETHIIIDGDRTTELFSDAVRTAVATGKSGLIEGDGGPLFVNVYLPTPRIIVIGAVHIAQALALMAPVAGFMLTIIDPRTAFATPQRFAGVDLVAEWPQDVLEQTLPDAYTAMVALSHDPKIDDTPLIFALEADCFYVGALGSRKSHAKRVGRLLEAGVTDSAVARIHAPIGLDIGAATPAEIAVAILAEIIFSLRRRNDRRLQVVTPGLMS